MIYNRKEFVTISGMPRVLKLLHVVVPTPRTSVVKAVPTSRQLIYFWFYDRNEVCGYNRVRGINSRGSRWDSTEMAVYPDSYVQP